MAAACIGSIGFIESAVSCVAVRYLLLFKIQKVYPELHIWAPCGPRLRSKSVYPEANMGTTYS